MACFRNQASFSPPQIHPRSTSLPVFRSAGRQQKQRHHTELHNRSWNLWVMSLWLHPWFKQSMVQAVKMQIGRQPGARATRACRTDAKGYFTKADVTKYYSLLSFCCKSFDKQQTKDFISGCTHHIFVYLCKSDLWIELVDRLRSLFVKLCSVFVIQPEIFWAFSFLLTAWTIMTIKA